MLLHDDEEEVSQIGTSGVKGEATIQQEDASTNMVPET